MWFSVVCTLIDNDTRHHSGQNIVDSLGCASWVRNKFRPLWWRASLSIRVHTTVNYIRFVFYHNIKHNEIIFSLDNWKHRLGFESARAALCKWAACTRQTFLSKTFTNSLNMQKQYEKNVWETSNDTYSLSVRVQTTINHISIGFLPQYQRQRKYFSSERELKRALRDTLTRGAWYGL